MFHNDAPVDNLRGQDFPGEGREETFQSAKKDCRWDGSSVRRYRAHSRGESRECGAESGCFGAFIVFGGFGADSGPRGCTGKRNPLRFQER